MPTYIDLGTAPAWRALTPAQRSAWHFFAIDTPVRNSAGQLVVLNGWQMFNWVNCWLQTANYTPLIANPPTTLEPPPNPKLSAIIHPVRARNADGTTRTAGRAVIRIDEPIPSNTLVLLWSNHRPRSYGIWSHPRTAFHAAILRPGDTGFVDVYKPRSTGAGAIRNNNRTRLVGTHRHLRPGRPIFHVTTVNTLTGARNFSAIYPTP